MGGRNKVRPIKKLTKIEGLSTVQLLGYADISHSSMNEIMMKGKDLFNAQFLKLISAKDNQPLLDKMQKHMNQYASIHNQCVVEIGNRFKNDMKLDLAPIQITQMVEKFKEEYPALAKHDSQTLTHMAQEKAAKDRAEANKKKREKEEADAKAKKAKAGPQPKPESKPKGKIAKLNPKK